MTQNRDDTEGVPGGNGQHVSPAEFLWRAFLHIARLWHRPTPARRPSAYWLPSSRWRLLAGLLIQMFSRQ